MLPERLDAVLTDVNVDFQTEFIRRNRPATVISHKLGMKITRSLSFALPYKYVLSN